MTPSSSAPDDLRERRLNAILLFIVAACVVRLWLMPLGSSFWLDETFTAFLVHYGPRDASLAVAPQVVASVYYDLPRASVSLFGHSEVAYRLPSVLAMTIALLLIGRLAARLVHPRAAWFAVFACFALSGINYQAADARPYALGTCVAAASFWFLVRWLDSGRWREAFFFILAAGLLWRVHLTYWPLYIVVLLYAIVRIARRETPASWIDGAKVFAVLGAALVPVLLNALAILPQAAAHAYAPPPLYRELFNSLKLGLVVVCGIGAWLLSRWRPARSSADERELPTVGISSSWSAAVLIGGWWLLDPLCLFAYSRLSDNGIFLQRYLSVALPGVVLAAVAAAGWFMPPARWRQAALLLGVGVLLLLGQWSVAWPRHDRSDWRGAAEQLYLFGLVPETPVICPSPFLEARPPAWSPAYSLPGYFYAHLDAYPIPGSPILLPFEDSEQAVQYATAFTKEILPARARFAIYGWNQNVRPWRDWLAARPELAGWSHTTFDQFGDVWVVLFERSHGAVPALDD